MSNKHSLLMNDIELEWLSCDEISLTRLWQMAGKPQGREPKQYFRITEKAEFLCKLLEELKGSQCPPLPNRLTSKGSDHAARKWAAQITKIAQEVEPPIIRVKHGKFRGTFAHWKLALDYAGYLSPTLKSRFYEWVRDRIEEESNPDLSVERGIERGIKQWQRQGKPNRWIEERLEGKIVRHKFTDTLSQHGVKKPYEYAVCTDEINKPILGGTAKEIKTQRNLPKKKSLRDNLSRIELAALKLAEAIAEEQITSQNSQGFVQCRDACELSGNRVARVFQ